MKILFIIKKIDFIDPMGIELLSALAKKEGHMTSLYILDQGGLKERLKQLQPDIVVYSARTGEHKYYLEANRIIKKILPNIFFLMGGPHCTFFPEVMAEASLDAICLGEADLAWPEFLQKFPNIENISNIYTKKMYQEGVKPTIRSKNENLDSLPFLDRDLVYNEAPLLKRFPMRSFMGGRGCPNHCTYCFNHQYNQIYQGKGKICNRYSVSRVCAELKDLKERYPTKLIKFYDDVFVFAEDGWFNEFIDKYPKVVGLPFTCLTRADYLTESILLKLKHAGLVSISMSIEAGNDEVRNNIFKKKYAAPNHS